ncbi:MAG: hypothetical protein NVSMB56_18850 [Pyrinomonadaceae bacterium]
MNMNDNKPILEKLEPELVNRLTTRREAIVKTGLTLGALATTPVAPPPASSNTAAKASPSPMCW